MPGIFARIAAGEIPSYKVAENDNYLAFLDINPLTIGHTLVIPKREVDYIFDLDKEAYGGLMDFSREVALALKQAIPCKRICVTVLGFEVPHAHIHLIPSNYEADANFNRPKLKLQAWEMKQIAEKITTFIPFKH